MELCGIWWVDVGVGGEGLDGYGGGGGLAMLAEYDGGGAMLIWWLFWDKLFSIEGDFLLLAKQDKLLLEPGGDFGKLFSWVDNVKGV